MRQEAIYSIDFKVLKDGIHQFGFDIDDSFLSNFERSDLNGGEIRINIGLNKSATMLRLDIRLDGILSVQCDRCLDFFKLPVKYATQLNVKFGDINSDLSDADTEITLSENETELVLDKHFYDYINLCIPAQKVHPEESSCNTNMLEIIENMNMSDSDEDKTDPRWDALKHLMN